MQSSYKHSNLQQNPNIRQSHSEEMKIQDLNIALLTNPIFRAKCFTELIEYALPDYDYEDLYQIAQRVLFLDKNLSIKVNKSENITTKLKMDFSFSGDGRSEEIMNLFSKMLYKFLVKYRAEGTGSGGGMLENGGMLKSYLDYLSSKDGLNIDASVYLPESDYPTILDSLDRMLKDLTSKEIKQLFEYCISSDHVDSDFKLSILYMTGLNKVFNTMYTVWKYHVIALYHRLAKIITDGGSNYSITVSDDDISTASIELDIPIDDLAIAFNSLLIMKSTHKVIDIMYCGSELKITTPYILANQELLDLLMSKNSIISILEIVPSEILDGGMGINTYTVNMPQSNIESVDITKVLREVDYSVLFEAPQRIADSSSQKSSYRLFGDMWKLILKTLQGEHTLNDSAELIGSNYKIVTNSILDDLFTDAVEYLFGELDLNKANGICNDLMINNINRAMYAFILEDSSILGCLDTSRSQSGQQTKQPTEQSVSVKHLGKKGGQSKEDLDTTADVFKREKIKNISKTASNVVDDGIDFSEMTDKFIKWYIKNSSTNKPVATHNLSALSFYGPTEKLPSKVNTSNHRSNYGNNSFENYYNTASFHSDILNSALENKQELIDYCNSITNHATNRKDLSFQNILGGLNSNSDEDRNEDRSFTDSSVIYKTASLMGDFEQNLYNTLSRVLDNESKEVVSDCLYNLILGDISHEMYSKIFDEKNFKNYMGENVYFSDFIKSSDILDDLMKDLHFSHEEEESQRDLVVSAAVTDYLLNAVHIVGYMLRDCIRYTQLNGNSDNKKKPMKTIGGISYKGNNRSYDLDKIETRTMFNEYLKDMVNRFGEGIYR